MSEMKGREPARLVDASLASARAVDAAVACLEHGGLVALPTETVYGLAADATDGEAVAGIFEAKGRPHFNPLIAHVCDMNMAQRIGVFDPVSLHLAQMFWPGPLTIVVPLRPESGIHPLVTAGLDTIALRMPKGIVAEIVRRLGRPVAAPSANRSGRISPTTAQSVMQDLGLRIDLVVDGGPTAVGVESTIVKAEGEAVVLLRPGGVAREDIAAAAGVPVRSASGGTVVAPGMLSSHYAPSAHMRLAVTDVRPGEALLAFGPARAAQAANAFAVRNLSAKGDLREAAANLFADLRALDETGVSTIAVEPIPAHGLGEAINDRLARAAAPRGSAEGAG